MAQKRIGIIGCGGRITGVTSRVQETARERDHEAPVVALCDPHQPSIERAREKLQCSDELREYTRFQDLVSDTDVGWVMVGSWNCQHAEHAIAALEAGKDVFCEKPLALSVEQCVAIRNAWQASGRQFTIGFTLRYSPHYRRIKELVDAGAIGEIISMEFNETLNFNHGGYFHADWRRKTEWAGSALLEKCCHDLDIVNWITNSTAKRVASFGGCDFFTAANADQIDRVGTDTSGRAAFQTWRTHDDILGNVTNPFTDDKDIVDNQVAIIEFANKVRATFHLNCSSGIPERRMYICGTEGALRADVIAGRIEVRRIGFDTEIEDHSTGASGGHGDGDPVLAASLVDSMFNDAPPTTSLEHGLRAAVTAFGIDRALATGSVVELQDLWREAGIEE